MPSDWSSDGRWLLGGCPQRATRHVATCLLEVREGEPRGARVRTLAADPSYNFFEQRFSPDQRWISFISVDTADAAVSTVLVMPAAGGPSRAITDGLAYDDKPHWSPDGRTIYYVSHRDGVLNVWGRRFDPSTGMASGHTVPRHTVQHAAPDDFETALADADRRHRESPVSPSH